MGMIGEYRVTRVTIFKRTRVLCFEGAPLEFIMTLTMSPTCSSFREHLPTSDLAAGLQNNYLLPHHLQTLPVLPRLFDKGYKNHNTEREHVWYWRYSISCRTYGSYGCAWQNWDHKKIKISHPKSPSWTTNKTGINWSRNRVNLGGSSWLWPRWLFPHLDSKRAKPGQNNFKKEKTGGFSRRIVLSPVISTHKP